MHPIDNKSALVQVMAWCWTGNKPLPETIVRRQVITCTNANPVHPHIYGTRDRWVNKLWHHKSRSALAEVIDCHLFYPKPLPELILIYYHLDIKGQINWNFNKNSKCVIEEHAFENVCKIAALLLFVNSRNIVWCHYNAVNFLLNILYSRKTPHSSPVRARYGVCFVGSASDWQSASIPAMMCAIWCYIGPNYKALNCTVICISRDNLCHINWSLENKTVIKIINSSKKFEKD